MICDVWGVNERNESFVVNALAIWGVLTFTKAVSVPYPFREILNLPVLDWEPLHNYRNS